MSPSLVKILILVYISLLTRVRAGYGHLDYKGFSGHIGHGHKGHGYGGGHLDYKGKLYTNFGLSSRHSTLQGSAATRVITRVIMEDTTTTGVDMTMEYTVMAAVDTWTTLIIINSITDVLGDVTLQ